MGLFNVDGWKYYNHAIIPTTAPHDNVKATYVIDGSVWRSYKKALFARWTSDFDCGFETDWWWIIKDAPYSIDELSSSTRKHIRQALKKCNVKKINACDEIEALWLVYESAYKKYKLADNHLSSKQFYEAMKSADDFDCWAAYDIENNQMIGWMTCKASVDWVSTVTAKYDCDNLNKRASDAIHHTICEYYLNQLGKKYISAGERNINHITNSQEYKISNFQFRRAYCTLNLTYRWWVKFVIFSLYPFRKFLEKKDSTSFVHKIVTVLKMEEIARTFRK